MPEELKIKPEFFDNNLESESQKKSSPKAPIMLVAMISVLAIVAVVSASNQWVKSLKFPFLIPESERITNVDFAGDDFSNLITAGGIDTDLDGLSDYDEMYLYYTSPYLEDSDSDGFSDYEEIKNNHDPNCPQGQVCQTQGAPSGIIDTTGNFLEEFANLSDADLRQLLISQGLPEAEVNQLDSATLRQTFDETLKNFEQPDYFADLLKDTQIELTPNQIREMLLSQGMPEVDVSQFSDEDLLLIWQQAMAQAQQAGASLGD